MRRQYDSVAGLGIWAGNQMLDYAYPFIPQTDRDFFKFSELLLQNLCLTISKCAPMSSPSSSLLTGNETERKRRS